MDTLTSTMVSITSTLAATTATAVAAVISPTISPTISPQTTPNSNIAMSPEPTTDDNGIQLLCDWTINSYDCRDHDFIQIMLIVSTVSHVLMGFFCVWLLAYRNRGFNSQIIYNLFVPVGTGIRPKPMDCIIFFLAIACFFKIPANFPLIFNALQNDYWLRILLEELYWVFVMTGVTTFLVGLLYAMPVTTREGIFAVYQPETPFGGKALSPIHVLTPTTTQKNIMLFVGPIYPLFSGVGIGAVAGVYYDRGDMRMYNILMRVQYGNWVAIFYITAATFFYYGLKYTFILRANIILAETALKAPRAAFGIGNIVSRSPARFLFIQLQIMGFGGCAVTSLAGTLCLLWVCLRDKILRMESPRLPHTMSVFWTCAMAIAVLVVSSLTAAQSVKSRKRSMHDPSSSLTHPTELPPKGGSNPSAAAAAAAAVRSGSAGSSSLKHDNLYQNQSLNSKHSKQGVARSDAEACLTRGSSGDISSLHSVSYEKHSFDMIGEGLAMHDLENNLEDVNESSYYYQTTSLTPPPRPLAIPGLGQRAGGLSLQSPPVDENHSQLRESVFGGRTPREETSRVTASPPQSPTSGSYGNGYNLPIFPKSSLRSNSKSASGVFARSSIGSNAPFNSGSVSTPTTASPSRQSRGSSKYWPSSPTTPVQNSSQQSSYDQSMSASPPPQYSPTRKSNSQPVSQSGGGVRKQSNAGLWPNNFTNTADIGPTSQSAPIPVSSRGGRVEYESQGIELEPVNNSIQSSVEANYY